jgi:hypothetical protein
MKSAFPNVIGAILVGSVLVGTLAPAGVAFADHPLAPPAEPTCTPMSYDSTPAPGLHALTYCTNTSATLVIQREELLQPIWVDDPTQASSYFQSGTTKVLDLSGMFQPASYTFRVCASNSLGQTCAAPETISPSFSQSTGGGGSAGQEPVVNPHRPNLQ